MGPTPIQVTKKEPKFRIFFTIIALVLINVQSEFDHSLYATIHTLDRSYRVGVHYLKRIFSLASWVDYSSRL